MKPEVVRLSQKARDQLMRSKRDTGIKNWNVLCRWALCLSLAESAPPAPTRIVTDSNVEMKWDTFGGEFADLYWLLVTQRCVADGFGSSPDVVAEQFKQHLHRGIGYLFGDPTLKSLPGLLGRAIGDVVR